MNDNADPRPSEAPDVSSPPASPSADASSATGAGSGEDVSWDVVSAKAKEIWGRLGPAGYLAVIAASLPGIGGFVLLGLLTRLAPWLRDQAEFGIGLYVLGFAVAAGLALLPTYAQAVLAGWAFGLTRGSAAAIAGFMGASIIGYVIARRASQDRVVKLIEEHPKWKAVCDSLLQSGFAKSLLIVTLLRLPPNSPFAITNLVLAATRVRPLTYIIGTLVGLTPRTVLAVLIGARGAGTDFASTRQTWFFIVGIVAALIVVGIVGAMANRAISKVTAAAAPDKAHGR